MDGSPKVRVVNRNRLARPSQPQRGERQVVITMTRATCAGTRHDADKPRESVNRVLAEHPE